MDELDKLIEFSASGNNFRYFPDIDSMSEKELNEFDYYRGFPCPHGHNIRDKENHWCYHCAIKIQSNICGFDIIRSNGKSYVCDVNGWSFVKGSEKYDDDCG